MTMIALGETAQFINGAAFKPTDWSDQGLPIIRIQNLTGTGDSFNYTNRKVKPDLVVNQGDLLVSWSATLDVYRWAGPQGLLNQHIFKVLPKAGVDPDYLYYALKSALAELSSKTHGSTMKHVVRGDFESTKVRLPNIQEQKRIVDILSRADGILRLRREAQQKAAELVPAIFLGMFGDPATNSKGWQTKSIDEVVSSIDSGHSPKCHDRPAGQKEWGVLKLSSITPCEYAEHQHKTLPVEMRADESVQVRAGDVLLSRKNTFDLVGASVYVWGTRGRMLLPDLIFRLNIADPSRLHPIYLWGLLTQTEMRARMRRLSSGSAGSMPNISKQRLRTLELPLPPIANQMKYAALVERMRAIRTRQTSAVNVAQATFDGLLAQVFV